PFTANRDGQLAAGDNDRALALPPQFARETCMGSGDVACFAFDPVAEGNAFVTGRAHRSFGCAHAVDRSGGQRELAAGKWRIAWLWRFVFLIAQRLRDRDWSCDFVFRDDGSRVGK